MDIMHEFSFSEYHLFQNQVHKFYMLEVLRESHWIKIKSLAGLHSSGGICFRLLAGLSSLRL